MIGSVSLSRTTQPKSTFSPQTQADPRIDARITSHRLATPAA
jgi:hypothetical protein